MVDYGVTQQGFVIKPLTAILQDKFDRALAMFGSDADLRSTSSLRKLLDITSAEDQNLWKGMEQFYYSNFISTASGDALDLLGGDMAVARRFLTSTGTVTLKLSNSAPGKVYNLPTGTMLETDAPVHHFYTLSLAALSDQNKQAIVDVAALERGPASNVGPKAINKINADYAQRHLNLGPATIAVSNDAPTTGGDAQEDDASYRNLLLGYPRTLWTLESIRRAVKAIDGVRDCRLFDPLGGVDISQSLFKLFAFSQRRFGAQRLLGTPYYFDILVAVEPGFPWLSQPGITGVQDTINTTITDIRPISIFPNIRLANNVTIGLRANIQVKAGHDKDGIVASIKDRLSRRVNALGLGGSVLFSEVQVDCMGVSGVVDVQGLHLRRSPPQFARVAFGNLLTFQGEVIEAAIGENIDLQPNEIAVFQVDSNLIQIEVSDR
jgi:Baseplate J-like protein